MSRETTPTENVVAELRRRAVRREWTGDPIDGGVGWVEHSDPFLVSAAALIESQRATIERLEASWRKLDNTANEWADRAHAAEARVTALEATLADVLATNQRFRDQMPADWEGDPMQDACDRARAALSPAARRRTMIDVHERLEAIVRMCANAQENAHGASDEVLSSYANIAYVAGQAAAALSQAGAGGVVDVEALTYRVANAKLGEGPSVRCEGPTDFEKDQARAWVKRVLAALAASPSAGETVAWRDMASAPKDATEIILRLPCKGWPDHYSMIGHWAQDLSGEEQPPFQGWFWRHAHGFAQLSEPTGWRPLSSATPPAPVQTASVEAVADIVYAIRETTGRMEDGEFVQQYALSFEEAQKLVASLTAPTQGEGWRDAGFGIYHSGDYSICHTGPRVTWCWQADGTWTEASDLEAAKAAVAAHRATLSTPSSPVSSPSPAGGERKSYISADNGQGMGLPQRCVRYRCGGEISDNGSDNICQKCGASYGRD